MSRKLIAVVAFAFVLALTCAAYAEVQNVKIGGDISIMGFSRHGFNFEQDEQALSSKSDATGLAEIANIKIDADLTDAVAATIVVRNERIWGATGTRTVTDTNGDDVTITNQDSDLDTYLAAAFVTLKEFMGQPITVKVGQMGFKLGSGLLIADPNTNQISNGPFNYALADLCPRKAFTGAVGIFDLAPVTITAGALKVSEGSVLINSDDVNAYVVNAAFDLKEVGLESGVAEVYDVLRSAKRTSSNTEATQVNNIGVRVQAGLVENLTAGGEFVYQAQKGIRTDRKSSTDSALLLNANFVMPDVVMAPSIGLDFTRLSQNWHVMFEGMTPADIANVIFPNTNVQCIGATLGLKPMTDVGVTVRYANLKAVHGVDTFDSNWANGDAYELDAGQKALGNELDIHLAYDYTEDVQFGLNGGYFVPGKAFDRNNRKAASQVIGSMKVTF